MWEIAARRPPYEKASPTIIPTVVLQGEREEVLEGCPYTYMELVQQCWHKDPYIRPDIDQVLHGIIRIVDRSLPHSLPIQNFNLEYPHQAPIAEPLQPPVTSTVQHSVPSNSLSQNLNCQSSTTMLNDSSLQSVSHTITSQFSNPPSSSADSYVTSQVLRAVVEIARNIRSPQLVCLDAPNKGVIDAAKSLAEAVPVISQQIQLDHVIENTNTIAIHLKHLINNGKVLAAGVSGQIRSGIQALNKTIQEACEVMVDLLMTGTGTEKLTGITTNTIVVMEDLIKESRRVTLSLNLANVIETMSTNTERLAKCTSPQLLSYINLLILMLFRYH